MKIEILYKDDSYKNLILEEIKNNDFVYEEKDISGVYLFSFERKANDEKSAKLLSKLLSQLKNKLDITKYYVFTD